MDYFDLADPHDGRLAGAFADSKDVRFTLVSFDTDWLYPTSDSRRVVQALQSVGAAASFVELSAPFGHDSFQLDVPALARLGACALGSGFLWPCAPSSRSSPMPCPRRHASSPSSDHTRLHSSTLRASPCPS